MAEIKLNDGFYAELEALRAAGNALNSEGVSSSFVCMTGLSLQTVEAYQERLLKIRDLMSQFQDFIEKDVEDMTAHADELKAADAS